MEPSEKQVISRANVTGMQAVHSTGACNDAAREAQAVVLAHDTVQVAAAHPAPARAGLPSRAGRSGADATRAATAGPAAVLSYPRRLAPAFSAPFPGNPALLARALTAPGLVTGGPPQGDGSAAALRDGLA